MSTKQATPAIEEGPYYKTGSPERTRLYEDGIPGERLTLTGYVKDSSGKPIAHAWIDFWQANGEGIYDNKGYTLRGHQYTDESGKYILETVVPGGYDVRTPHIHAKVRATDKSPILTTQLFLSGISQKSDFLFRDGAVIETKDTHQGKQGSYDFVVES
jgi:protocatechuate 3,4-dioxygenase beta subunit